MRTIIAGSRRFTVGMAVIWAVEEAKEKGIVPTIVLSGTARGIDRLGEAWAEDMGIPVERFPADWKTYGRSAGYRRNQAMANEAEALIAIWDGRSNGTRHMINIATDMGLKVHVKEITQ